MLANGRWDLIRRLKGLSCQVLMEFEISRQIFEKYPNVKFNENPSSGRRVVSCGQTDRHDETNSHFSKSCERA
jgi:hypothetical protein